MKINIAWYFIAALSLAYLTAKLNEWLGEKVIYLYTTIIAILIIIEIVFRLTR